jgi:hypothetical protein
MIVILRDVDMLHISSCFRHSSFLVLYICLVTWVFTILKDSYLIQKALEVRVCSYVWRLVLSVTLLTAGRGHVGLLWHSYNGL